MMLVRAELFGDCFDGAMWMFLKLCSMAYKVWRVGELQSCLSQSVVTLTRHGEMLGFGD